MRKLPAPPSGWAWQYGQTAPKCWAIWLRRIGSVGAWYVVGLSPVDTARELCALVWAYSQGYQHADK